MAKKEKEHSKNFYKIKGYYDSGLWDQERVYNVVGHKNGIYDWEYVEIVGENYV